MTRPHSRILVQTRDHDFGGVGHAGFAQWVAGLNVYGTYVKATFAASGDLLSVTENLVSTSRALQPAQIGPDAALRAVLVRYYPGGNSGPSRYQDHRQRQCFRATRRIDYSVFRDEDRGFLTGAMSCAQPAYFDSSSPACSPARRLRRPRMPSSIPRQQVGAGVAHARPGPPCSGRSISRRDPARVPSCSTRRDNVARPRADEGTRVRRRRAPDLRPARGRA